MTRQSNKTPKTDPKQRRPAPVEVKPTAAQQADEVLQDEAAIEESGDTSEGDTIAVDLVETKVEETQPEPPAVEEPKVEPVAASTLFEQIAPAVPTAPATIDEYFAQRYPNMVEVPIGVRAMIENLDAYNEAMAPNRPIDARMAGQYQRSLYYAFIAALGLPGRQSQLALDAILWYFHTHRAGAFSQYLIFRPLPAKIMSAAEMSGLKMMLHLFYNTSDPTTRKVNLRAMVDMRKVVEALPTPKTRESLLNFYA